MTGFLQDGSRSHKMLGNFKQALKWIWDQGLLIASVILALYAVRQWKATNDTLKEITKQTPAVIQSGKAAEDAVKIAAAEAKSSDETTKKTLSLMKDQAEAAKSLANTTKLSAETSAQLMNQQVEAARSLAETTKAVSITSAKQLFMSQRPRIKLIRLEPDQLFVLVNHLGFHVQFQMLVTNEGQSTSQNTWLNGSVEFPSSVGRYLPLSALKATCAAPTGMDMRTGVTVSHGDQTLLQKGVSMPFSEFLDKLSKVVPDSEGFRTLKGHLDSCVVYGSDLSDQPLNSGTVYMFNVSISSDEFKRIAAFNSNSSDADYVYIPKDKVFALQTTVMNGYEN
jgi:hypothetical protein